MADKIQIDVEFNLKKAKKSASQAANHFENSVKKSSVGVTNVFGKIGKSFGNMLNVATASIYFRIVNGLIDGFKEVAKSALEFEKAIAEINTLLPGFNTLNSRAVDGIRDLSKEFGKDKRDLAGAYYNIVSAGVTKVNESLELLEASTKAAAAGLTDVETSAGAIISVMQAYKGSNVTATEAAEKLFETVVIGRTRFDELSSKIGQVVPVAAQAGASLNELLGFLGEATRTSGNTARTVTALRSAFTSIIGPSEEAKRQLKDINKVLGTNLEFSSKALKEKGLVKFLDDINKAASKFENREEILKKLFGNVRGLTAVLSVASDNTDSLAEAVKRLNNASELNTSTLETANTVTSQFNIALEILKDMFSPIGEAILTFIKGPLLLFNAAMGNQQAITLIQKKLIEMGVSIGLGSKKFKEAAKNTNSFNQKVEEGYYVLRKTANAADGLFGQLVDFGDMPDVITANLVPVEKIKKEQKKLTLLPSSKVDAANNKVKAFEAMLFQRLKSTYEMLGQNFAAIYDTEEGKDKIEAQLQALRESFKVDGIEFSMTMSQESMDKNLEVLSQAKKNLAEMSPFTLMKKKGDTEIGSLSDALAGLVADGKIFAAQMKKNVAGTAASALTKGFAAMGAGAMSGADMVKMAGRAMMDSFGDQIIAKGQAYMVEGAAELFRMNPAGAGLMAQGGALAALGGLIKAKLGSGGGGGVAGAAGGGGGGGAGAAVRNEPPEFGPEVLEEQEPRTQINVNIEGNVLDSRSSSLQIVELINEAYNRDGVIVEQGV